MKAIWSRPNVKWGAAAAVLLVICVFSVFRAVRVETWQIRTVATGDWGAIEPRATMTPKASPAFALDPKGNLVMVDPSSRSIVIYQDGGAKKTSIVLQNAPAPVEIHVSQDGAIFGVPEGRQNVVRYIPDGSCVPVYSQAAGDVYFIEGISVFGSGTLYVQDVTLEKQHYTRRLTRVTPGSQTVATLAAVSRSRAGDSKEADKVPITGEVDDFAVARDGTLVVLSGTHDAHARTVTRLSASGKSAKFTVRETDFIRSCRLLGQDAQGNVYLGMILGKEPRAIIHKYSSSGQKVGEIPVKGYIGGTDIKGRVDAAGNLYIGRLSDTSFYIDKYSPRSEVKWVSRFSAGK